MTPKQEEETEGLASRISKETGLPIAEIRKRVQEATAKGQDALDELKGEFPFLARAETALVKDGGRINKEKGGIMEMASAPGPKDDYDDIARELFGKGYKDLTPEEMEMMQEELERLMQKFRGAKGGIASMAEGGMMDRDWETNSSLAISS